MIDLLWYAPVLLGFLGFSFGGSKTSSSQDVKPLGGRTDEVRGMVSDLFKQGRSDPFSYTPNMPNTVNAPIGWRQFTPSGQYGLIPEAEQPVNTMLNYAVNRVSGGEAGRGFVHPENIPNIAGSAITNVLPQLLPLIQAYQQWRMMMPEQVRNEQIRQAAPFTGASTTASSNTFQWGVGGGLGAGGGSPMPLPSAR